MRQVPFLVLTLFSRQQDQLKNPNFPSPPFTEFKAFSRLHLTPTFLIRNQHWSNRFILVEIPILLPQFLSSVVSEWFCVWRSFNGGGPEWGEWLQFGGRRNRRLQAWRVPCGSDWWHFQEWELCGAEQAWLGSFFHCLARLGHSQIGACTFVCFLIAQLGGAKNECFWRFTFSLESLSFVLYLGCYGVCAWEISTKRGLLSLFVILFFGAVD